MTVPSKSLCACSIAAVGLRRTRGTTADPLKKSSLPPNASVVVKGTLEMGLEDKFDKTEGTSGRIAPQFSFF
jgi:hypothetical protein